MEAAELLKLLPLFVEWIGLVKSRNQDPEAELRAMMNSADTTADLAEKTKFGG